MKAKLSEALKDAMKREHALAEAEDLEVEIALAEAALRKKDRMEAALRKQNLPMAEKLLLACLCLESDCVGWCYTSNARLGRMLGVKRRYVQMLMARLVERGLVDPNRKDVLRMISLKKLFMPGETK